MTPVRMAVVGCGAVADIYHLPALRRVRGASLTAVVDSDADRARAMARRHGAQNALTTPDVLPGMVDAALIATPNATHAEIACFLLSRGVHVLCEKPMATTLADAQKMVAAATSGGGRLMAAHSRRFNLNVVACRSLLQRQQLGTIQRISAGLGGPYGRWPGRTDFRRHRSLSGGGVLLDLGIHLIDLVLWLTGQSVSVESYSASDGLGWGVESDVELVLRLAGRGEARLSCSCTRGLDRTLRVEGSEGWATTSIDPAPAVTFFSRRARLCRTAGVQRLCVEQVDPYDGQIQHFVDCLRRDVPFAVDNADILAGLDVVERCYEVERAA